MDALVRVARDEDVQAVLDVWREAEAEVSVTDDPESVARLIARGEGSLLLADLDGRVVGTLVAAFDGWRGNLYRLAVIPEARRRGIATALVREAERRLREAGARRIAAIVLADNGGAVGFWGAAGYELFEGAERFVKSLEIG